MQRHEFETSIARAWHKIHELRLGETFSNGGSLEVSTAFRDCILDPTSRYEDIFLLGLTSSNYNFLLFDHSYFQFSWTGESEVRYAYYPNPFIGAESAHLLNYKKRHELLSAEFLDYDDFLQLMNESRGQGRIPVWRYENAPEQYKPIHHPCSHFHIGLHGEDRWPVRRFLHPLAFALLIVKNYYGDAWKAFGTTDEETGLLPLDNELLLARQSCSPIVGDYFNDHEERTFHIS